jgi:cellobiose phosphorylase
MSRQAVLLLGDGRGIEDIRAAVARFAAFEQARDSLRDTCRHWRDELSVVKARTPDTWRAKSRATSIGSS